MSDLRLYHPDIWVPDEVWDALGWPHSAPIHLSNHAESKSTSNKYLGKKDNNDDNVWVQPREHIDIFPRQVFEIEADWDTGFPEITKLGFRTPEFEVVNAHNDYSEYVLCLIINPDGFARTLYLNKSTDSHETLNKNKYETPPSASSVQ